MAIYHLSTNVHSRGKGHSAVAAAAYRSGEKLYDERLGEIYNWQDYRKSHGEVVVSEIFLPKGADEKYLDRSTLWNGAESSEKTKAGAYKKTSAIAREIEASLPVEMNDKQREELARKHAAFLVERYGAAVDMNIHAPHPDGNQKNHHVHFLMTTRELKGESFRGKTELEVNSKTKQKMGYANGKAQIKEMRENWANDLNQEMERGGYDMRVDHRSYEDQGKEQKPTKHMGAAATDMERKGKQTDRGDINREIEYWNRDLAELRWQESIITAAIEKEKQNIKEQFFALENPKEPETKNYQSFAEELSKQREFEMQQEKRRDDLAMQLRETYHREETESQLWEARHQVTKHDNFLGKLSGKYRAALDDVTAYQNNLENIKQRENEQTDALENNLRAEQQEFEQSQSQEQPKEIPQYESVRELQEHFANTDKSQSSNDNEQQQGRA